MLCYVKVQINTGLQRVGSLNALCSIIEPKAETMRYWDGSKSSFKSRSKKLKCNCKAVHPTPIKPGIRRRLSVNSELVLLLMNSDFVFLMPFLLGRDADLACLASVWRLKRGFHQCLIYQTHIYSLLVCSI